MYTDGQQLFSDAQAFTTDAASTNLIDLGAAREIGQGEPMGIAILVDVAAKTSDANETYEFQLETDSAEAFNVAIVDVITQSIAKADLVAGSLHVLPISPANALLFKRFIRIYFNGGGTNPAITATIWLTPLNMVAGRAKVYPDGITIS